MVSYPRRKEYQINTAANWASLNPLIEAGLLCVEVDTGVMKVGDGVSLYNALPDVPQQEDLGTAAAADLTTSATDTTAGRVMTTGAGPAQAFRRGNILGTVSRSSGTPTGAVIERGSGPNGEFVRFADGTQICTRLVTLEDLQIDVATGSLYSSTSSDYDFPASFGNTADYVSGDIIGSTSFAIRSNTVAVKLRSTFTSAVGDWGGVKVFNTSEITGTGSTTYLRLLAVGRWN